MAIGDRKPPVALIAGPTASGKSALALALAERTGGVIVNADSAQIYRDLPVLSAAPGQDDLHRAEHRLYAIRDGSSPCSAAEWAELAKAELADVHHSGRLPILVGGTGLYIKTLIDGIAPVPEILPAVRAEVRQGSLEENRSRLEQADPEAAARLKPTDRVRTARALEVVLSTGRTLQEWQKRSEGGIGDRVALCPLILLPPRPWLYERCDARFKAMMEHGAVEEVRTLLARRLDSSLPVMRAIGVREIAAFLNGEITVEQAVTLGQQATRNYAKRQYTWFTHQPPRAWPRFTRALEAKTIGEALAQFEARA